MKLLIGGSPCTYWSIEQTKNRETEASGLGWELFRNYVIARDVFKPDYFLYENNKSMSAAIRAQITEMLGVEPVLINSALVSAQNRQRLYWVGRREPDGSYSKVEVEQPEDRGILLRDVLESGACWREKGYALLGESSATAEDMIARRQRNGVAVPVCINQNANGKARTVDAHMAKLEDCLVPRINNPNPAKQQYDCIVEPVRIGVIEGAKETGYDWSKQYKVYSPDGKATALCGNGGGAGAKTGLYATPVCVAQRGRYTREDGGTEQHFEVQDSGKTNTLTTVQKDNLVAEPVHPAAMRQVGRRINEQGHRDDYNENLECVQRFEVNEDPQKTNCLTTVQKDNLVAVPAGMAWRGHATNGNTSSFEMRKDGKSNAVIVGHQNRLVIEADDGKTYPVYEVRDGFITINGKRYPIKLADGWYIIRKLTVTECKRLQTVPEDYEFPVSQTQAYKMLGNGWTVDVIAHIMSFMEGIEGGQRPLDVLSMYDGMACGHIALDKLHANIRRYCATEIDKYAIKTATHNFPDIEELGDAFQIRGGEEKKEEASA